ncbi:MAG: Unknown protein [uncultured Thiotrichaceae bacterium]|uniref:Cytochrome c domain-containing protein n=1 Tax=uncultured Thiotrichaceae bacterium TaxID=298394 RepID=A0A6S6SX11_9GAMM|nr:MAG: Unknown protein [uncultured Thiotrichaceae bacterium]
MKSILFLATSLLLSFSVHAEVPNIASGQRLFAESRCLECHGVDVFTSKDRKVKDLAGLERKVRQCDASLSTNWFDDQILDVVAYLNATYYKFKPTTASETAKADALIDVAEKPKTE